MKISEMITSLQNSLEQFGDVEIIVTVTKDNGYLGDNYQYIDSVHRELETGAIEVKVRRQPKAGFTHGHTT